jgi:hypothetical protein
MKQHQVLIEDSPSFLEALDHILPSLHRFVPLICSNYQFQLKQDFYRQLSDHHL